MIDDLRHEFIARHFLLSLWANDYAAFRSSEKESLLYDTLKKWSERLDLGETSSEAAFQKTFFCDLWGYTFTGTDETHKGYTLYPQYPVKGGGQGGGTGQADLALGYFSRDKSTSIPQVLCEFKDIRSALDAPQKSRKNTRSPVKQCLDYLSASRRNMLGNEPIVPTWGIVTDMNEFRLYWYDRAPQQYLKFVIQPSHLFHGEGLLDKTEQARFNRFLFYTLFHRETLLAESGKSKLVRVITQQWIKERELETLFYKEYRALREKMYQTLVASNPTFAGTKGRLVRLAQKILDRFIFIFFCEDMGQSLSFPPQLLRDFLVHESNDAYFDPSSTTIWQRVLSLFHAMNVGTSFGDKRINQFNGGLFAHDPELESLIVPNSVFCVRGQGQNEASLNAHKETILYLSAAYNYASDVNNVASLSVANAHNDLVSALKNDPSKGIGLYTLGRIFEQSITELEILEAEAEGKKSLNIEGKRKRDGVYYTPEWVVERIVTEAIGSRIDDLKKECGWVENALPDSEAITRFRKRLEKLTVVDPACGSGAFLITALRFLLQEWRALQEVTLQVTGKQLTQEDSSYAVIRGILKNNLYGVDINPASVEIARLALWLHTAEGNKPLSSLEENIVTGNSLIDDDFYKGQIDMEFYSEEQKDRINTFNWWDQFPDVAENGGFDVVVGNPPYVKLQNFRTVHSDMALYLREGRNGIKPYKSTQTGNFDLYLPFIEKGLNLLNEDGRMGYIAPSLWVMNEYGVGLRTEILCNQQLYGWVDFKSFQVFEEATIYTALQFFSKQPSDSIRIASAPDGRIAEKPWQDKDCALTYNAVAFHSRWLLLTGKERALVDKLNTQCLTLKNSKITNAIYQGLITSADSIYHVTRIAAGKYRCTPKGKNAPPPYEVILEEGIMKPLISGAEAKRYTTPATETYLLFPYHQKEGKMELITEEEMTEHYPNAWKYLQSYEKELRNREKKKGEKGKFDDDQWYRFGRHQGLNKQAISKLIVAQTVPSLRVCAGTDQHYLNNVRVNGILPAQNISIWFLLGILNSPVCDFVFKRIAKVKDNNYYEANKQFIAPLPIPKATKPQQEKVATQAEALQRNHTRKRDVIARINQRITATPSKVKPLEWLLPELKKMDQWLESAPSSLDSREKSAWAKARYLEEEDAHYRDITERLNPACVMDASFADGELQFTIDGAPVIRNIFLNDHEGRFALAQWKVLAHTFTVTEKTDGKKLCAALRKLVVTDNTALVEQMIGYQGELSALETEIAAQEAALNAFIYQLYKLNDKEIALIEQNKH